MAIYFADIEHSVEVSVYSHPSQASFIKACEEDSRDRDYTVFIAEKLRDLVDKIYGVDEFDYKTDESLDDDDRHRVDSLLVMTGGDWDATIYWNWREEEWQAEPIDEFEAWLEWSRNDLSVGFYFKDEAEARDFVIQNKDNPGGGYETSAARKMQREFGDQLNLTEEE